MARRRNKDFDIAMGVAQFVAVLLLGVVFVPPLRHLFLGLGAILFGFVVLAGVVGRGVLLLRRAGRPRDVSPPPRSFRRTEELSVPLDCAVPARDIAPPSGFHSSEPQTPKSTTDLVRQLRDIDWFQFEKIVGLAYRKLGYGVTSRGGANPDGGIDLLIEKDGQRSAVQCKQWKTWNVGVKAVREFLGALTDAGIQNGIFITLVGYSTDAKQLAVKHGIEIVNEVGLAKLLELSDARFDPEVLATLRDTRKCCPKCGAEMVLRTATNGRNPGQQFWGCSNYASRRCLGRLPYKPQPSPALAAA